MLDMCVLSHLIPFGVQTCRTTDELEEWKYMYTAQTQIDFDNK